LLAIYVAICLPSLVWPVYSRFGASIEPYVLGLPLSLLWVVGWVGLTFLVVLAYHLAGDDERG
jgi:hypothetical protein